MNELTFKRFIKNICLYFEKKSTNETLDIWCQEIIKIPEESLDYITVELKKKESFPRNLPATVWAIYYVWLKESKKQALNFCPDCDGSGWITENQKAYRCGNCDKSPLEAFFSNPGFSGNLKIQTKIKTNQDWHEREWKDQF